MLEAHQLQNLFRYALSLTNHNQSAEDLVQSALENWLPRQTQIDNPMAYLRRSIRNLFIDQCRRQKLIAFEDIDEHYPTLLDSQSLEDLMIDKDQVEKILSLLGNAEREVLFMWAVEGFSAQEIADLLLISRGTVLSRLYRLREKVNQLNSKTSANVAGISRGRRP